MYHSRVNPPRPDPKAIPMFPVAELSDIIAPRYLGICSMVKLLDDEALTPENRLPKKAKPIDSQRFDTLRNHIVKTPANTLEITVTFFLPNLLTTHPLTRLPTVYDNAPNTMNNELKSELNKNLCLKNETL